MTNAKQELLHLLRDVPNILCATIQHKGLSFNLKQGFSNTEWDVFIDSLNFEYDSSYGCQELFGTIWFNNGTWAERHEYDGSEWWTHNTCPPIPSKLE